MTTIADDGIDRDCRRLPETKESYFHFKNQRLIALRGTLRDIIQADAFSATNWFAAVQHKPLKAPQASCLRGFFLLSAQWILPSTCSSSVSRVKALKLLNNDFTVQVAIGGVLKTNRLVAGAARQ